ncbi:HDL464Wp [Eremothecium sinecaudum]|uniref:HDL464Wp n=1 Tax=Eremothecium sinecaudum TaxID=45286 RepID=A0A120K234_9SACH|nr:HDL464Wp [Eremothecium sinecaudum]AMD20280.1 HDL464Wp [Eremothecium sinecaudum]
MAITINIKSGQNKWEVKIEPSSTVAELKEEIHNASGIAAENQRLIYSGKILKDDQTVESYKIVDGHAVHMVKAGGNKGSAGATSGGESGNSNAAGGERAGAVPTNISAGQAGGFNPLADLTGARYAGYANLPSTDIFGPDGGLNSAVGQEEILSMLENPTFQSQMNEMLNNPQMIDFLIQQHPHLQAMGPAAREMLQSPLFRQMMTNPDMIRQMSRMQMDMGGGADAGGDFPAPGSGAASGGNESQQQHNSGSNAAAGANNMANPFASLLNAQSNPFAAMFAPPGGNTRSTDGQQQGRGLGLPPLDPAMLSAMFGGAGATPPAAREQDNRPPEERYEQQLRQLNDMGFFDFDRNVAALRRSGGSVAGALDALLNGDV